MSTSKNGLDAFERSMRDSLDQFEVPYNSSDWAQMERTLNGGGRSWWVSGIGLSVLVAGLVVAGGGAWYALSSEASGQDDRTSQQTVASVPSPSVEAPTNGALVVEDAASAHESSTSASGSEKVSAVVAKESEKAAPAVERSKASSLVSAAAKTGEASGAKGATPIASTTSAPASTPNEITFKASVADGCPGTAVEFKVTNMPEDGIYLWNFGDGSFSNHPNPEHTFTKPGRYQVMLSMSAAGVGTIQNKPSSDVIEIHEAPMAAFNILKQEYDGHLPSVHFENRSLAGEQYLWDFGDGQTSKIAHPDHIYKKKGVYQVELTVTNKTGCEDKIMKDVRIDQDYNLDAPGSFSPNGDDFQETFMPEALRTLGVKFNLTVYSSNGTLLYQTNDATKPWTGRPQNKGNLCGAGEYVWVVDVRESLHLAETYTGKVKLER